MFRATFKKRKKSVTRLRSDSDDDDDGGNHDNYGAKETSASKPPKETENDNGEEEISNISKLKKKKTKMKGLVVRSFDVGEGDDHVDATGGSSRKEKSRKRKRGGLGFGGASTALQDDNDNDVDHVGGNHVETADNNNNNSSSLLYDKEALEKLKQEQKYKALVAVVADTTEGSSLPITDDTNKTDSLLKDRFTTSTPALDDYVPLNGNPTTADNGNVILTGDEAILFEDRNRGNNNLNELEKKKENHFDTVMSDANFLDDAEDLQLAEETSAWEAEITRRAGLQENDKANVDKKGTGSNSYQSGSSSAGGTSNNAVSVDKIRSQIQSTISQLETQQNDVDRACERRRVELTQTEAELQRQENELKHSGQALEDYQKLREQLAFWTGALRDLKSKVRPIQEALIGLDAEIANCSQWQDWENDMCSVLHQYGLLDRVLGRQPPDTVFEDTTTIVDEFGRDVKSQHAMNREKRTRRRLQMHSSRKPPFNEDDSDAFVDSYEIQSFRQRRAALTKALDVALGELEEDYTQLPKLVSIFRKWQTSYPDDYKQCYANLSLGDLASVLVQVELCKNRGTSHNAKGWLDGLSSDDADDENQKSLLFSWVDDFVLADEPRNLTSSSPTEESIDRVMEQCFLPVLSDVFDKSAYNLVSNKQSRSLSAIYTQLKKLNANRSTAAFGDLNSRVSAYIRSSLENVAIVILHRVDVDLTMNGGDEDENNLYRRAELQDAFRGATVGQIRRLSKMVVNVITFWSRQFQGEPNGQDMVEFLLDFLSSKYLFLLSSLRGLSNFTDDTAVVFSQVWSVLRKTKWLDQPGRMLQAAPLRAAAVAFNLD